MLSSVLHANIWTHIEWVHSSGHAGGNRDQTSRYRSTRAERGAWTAVEKCRLACALNRTKPKQMLGLRSILMRSHT